jgi:hypothetical protein
MNVEQRTECGELDQDPSQKKHQKAGYPGIRRLIVSQTSRFDSIFHDPDDTILSVSIPLFFIGRNQNGFWVAREAAGRCGGLFLFRWSAARFARRNSLAGGGATMLVEHSIELDLPNQGSRLVELIATIIDIVRRHAPLVATFIGMVIAVWRKLDSRISHLLADHRRNREAVENELFRGEYKLISKNDDELPIPR